MCRFWLSVDIVCDACRLPVASAICKPVCDAVTTLTVKRPTFHWYFYMNEKFGFSLRGGNVGRY